MGRCFLLVWMGGFVVCLDGQLFVCLDGYLFVWVGGCLFERGVLVCMNVWVFVVGTGGCLLLVRMGECLFAWMDSCLFGWAGVGLYMICCFKWMGVDLFGWMDGWMEERHMDE